MEIQDFKSKIDEQRVFRVIELKEDSPVYDETKKIYYKMVDKFWEIVNPMTLYKIVQNEVYVITTIGENISNEIDMAFNKGEFLSGIILNAIADCYLMDIDSEANSKIINQICSNGTLKLSPHENINAQKVIDIIKVTNAEKYNISVNSSFVISPNKSIAYILKLDNSINNFGNHNCKVCENIDCKWRKL